MPTPNTINELYFLCEELLAYTDLTGERFDKENAQRRLYPMLPLIKELKDESLLSSYQTLENQLDSFDFDKAVFADDVLALFNYIDNKRK